MSYTEITLGEAYLAYKDEGLSVKCNGDSRCFDYDEDYPEEWDALDLALGNPNDY